MRVRKVRSRGSPSRSPFGDELRDDLGRVLQIRVHDDDRVAPGMVESGGDGDLLAEIAAEGDGGQAPIGGADLAQRLQRVVLRAVVDEDDFERQADPLQHGQEPGDERPQIARFVEERRNDGKEGRRFGHRAPSITNLRRSVGGRG
jgi:hypothetical protein